MKKKTLILLLIILSILFACAPMNEVPFTTKLAVEKTYLNLPTKAIAVDIEVRTKEGKNIFPIHAFQNRYYLPLNSFTNNLSLTYNTSQPIYASKGNVLISLIDICSNFKLYPEWDFENKTITLIKSNAKEILSQTQSPSVDKELSAYKPALIRLEDFAPNPETTSVELEKTRIIANFLSSKNIPFHIAWIPRYINPGKNIDNDPSKQYSFFNSAFLFTLDYLLLKGGIIGLHGYTHQYDNSISGEGIEFHTTYLNDTVPNTEKYTRSRIESAIASAKSLNIDYTFFEAPHYAATPKQFKIFENYFDILYEPYTPDGFNELNTELYKAKNNEKTVFYVPTPLDYLKGISDLNNMLSKIRNLDQDFPASFFFHPYLEYPYIDLLESAEYEYSDQSPLHKIVKTLHDNNYKFVSVKTFVTQNQN